MLLRVLLQTAQQRGEAGAAADDDDPGALGKLPPAPDQVDDRLVGLRGQRLVTVASMFLTPKMMTSRPSTAVGAPIRSW